MTTTACFIIVSRNDIPIYEAEVGVAAKVCLFIFYFSFFYLSKKNLTCFLLDIGFSDYFRWIN